MTVVWILTWIGQSLALVALTSAFVGLPGCRANASARSIAWTVADRSVASGSCTLEENTPWWGRAAAFGAATGEGAATAGRTTASFLTRLGTRVSRPSTR
jgi:hypothetical protein